MKLYGVRNPNTLILLLYAGAIIGLVAYSYTQVDLNLTLSRASIIADIQQRVQYIGYFRRPLSALLYSSIVLMLFVLYAVVLDRSRRRVIGTRQIWKITGLIAVVLLISYPAFSYDIFNYMFDARIVTKYAENPYLHRALDYPNDPWVNVMRWTHRTYPYGPLWLVMTVPLSFISLQKFLLTLFVFKSLMVGSYVLTVLAIQKILLKISPRHVLLGMAAFALNPLVIVESTVSAHNDSVMMMLTLWAFYFIITKKYIHGWIAIILSGMIKFATAMLIPVIGWMWWRKKQGAKINWERVFVISLCAMIIAVIAATVRTQFQPWYLLYPLPFASLLFHKYYVSISALIVSFTGLLQYIPYLYTGNWDPPIPIILDTIMIVGVVIGFLGIGIYATIVKKT